MCSCSAQARPWRSPDLIKTNTCSATPMPISSDGAACRLSPTTDSWPPGMAPSDRCRSCWQRGLQHTSTSTLKGGSEPYTKVAVARRMDSGGGVCALLSRLDKVYRVSDRSRPNALMEVVW